MRADGPLALPLRSAAPASLRRNLTQLFPRAPKSKISIKFTRAQRRQGRRQLAIARHCSA